MNAESAPPSQLRYDSQSHELLCQGEWNLANFNKLDHSFKAIVWPKSGQISIQGQGISKMDTAGAWLLNRWSKRLEAGGLDIKTLNLPAAPDQLFQIIQEKSKDLQPLKPLPSPGWVEEVGRDTMSQLEEFKGYLAFVGKLSFDGLRVFKNPLRFRWPAIASTINKTGTQALSIIALLSFMIGVVIAYQMGFQLRNYGANVFIVDLLGLSVFREFGPLICAIMVAGRTGSAFTAQLGTMKINQEIDALDTLGITPGEILLLPRFLGLLISLPLLTMWSDIFGILGGMLMANNMLDVSWGDFLIRFQKEIPLRSLWLGLVKAPVFAALIATIGCFQGTEVQGSADSVGVRTTRSVVLSIFFIIITDALFSILYSKLRL